MRKARQEDRAALAALMFDQFYEKQELQQQFSGIDPETARKIGPTVLSLGQNYFFSRGDVFVCDAPDGSLAGALVAQTRAACPASARLGSFSMLCVTAAYCETSPILC